MKWTVEAPLCLYVWGVERLCLIILNQNKNTHFLCNHPREALSLHYSYRSEVMQVEH